jgi:formylglycine-generating enzyme required for sulfatase activity
MMKILAMAMIVLGMFFALIAGDATESTARAQQPRHGDIEDKELTLDLGNGVSMKLARIPAGDFIMGSSDAEKGHFTNEAPQHRVKITRPFFMGVTQVTQEQYTVVMANNPSGFSGKANPVESVSWDDAVAFCRKLSAKAGKTVRLPTEAEWEYACRAGSTTRFGFGDNDKELDKYAWYDGNSDRTSHPVGQKKPNAWGLYDMHGNVWQWCSDWYQDSYRDLGAVDPTGPAEGKSRVLRGGCWIDGSIFCRSASRGNLDPGRRFIYFGFRVVAGA